MKIYVPKETSPKETRVALTPEAVRNLIKSGFQCFIEKGAGEGSYFSDHEYAECGASVIPDRKQLLAEAEMLMAINAPSKEDIGLMKEGAVLICFMYAATHPDIVYACKERRISGFSVDAIPRISRAQKMDALSSQSNLGGYKAVLLSANVLGKIFPLMITAAGTLKPSKIIIMGAGVAGLQAIATAKRLGAIVEVSDIRPETKEQVESLGAKFIEVADDQNAVKTEGGYVKEVSPEFLKKQKEVVAKHVADADIVITTALVPGKKAPVLVTADMVKSMRHGSVILDMAVEQGGNCELSELNKTVIKNGVSIIGEPNLPSLLPMNASELYARNISAFLLHLADKNGFKWDMNDEITAGSLITHKGEIVHPAVAKALESVRQG